MHEDTKELKGRRKMPPKPQPYADYAKKMKLVSWWESVWSIVPV